MIKYIYTNLTYKLITTQKTILFGVLNWGLGHASRSSAIIDILIKEGHKIVIASDGIALDFLQKKYPNLLFEKLPAYNITYKRKSFLWDMILQVPKIVNAIKKELKDTQQLIDKHNIEFIISDNRYGVRSKNIPSVIICHQMNIATKVGSKIVNSQHQKLLSKFDQCWIPDFKSEVKLAGALSASINNTAKFIGPLSRFRNTLSNSVAKTIDILIVVSGPEPKRSKFEKSIIDSAPEHLKISIISPKLYQEGYQKKGLTILPQLSDSDYLNTINSSHYFITRNGYTTVMDLLYCKTTPIFIPTQGQLEQEYLGKYYQENNWCRFYSESEFNWSNINESITSNFPFKIWEEELNNKSELENIVKTFLK